MLLLLSMSYCVNECTQGDHKSYCTNVVKFSQTFYFSSKLIHEVILTSLIDQPIWPKISIVLKSGLCLLYYLKTPSCGLHLENINLNALQLRLCKILLL